MWWTMRLLVALLKNVSLLWMMKLQWNDMVVKNLSAVNDISYLSVCVCVDWYKKGKIESLKWQKHNRVNWKCTRQAPGIKFNSFCGDFLKCSCVETHWCILDRLKGAVKLSFSSRSGRVLLWNFMGLRGSQPRNLLMRFSILQVKFLLKLPEFCFVHRPHVASYTEYSPAHELVPSVHVKDFPPGIFRNIWNNIWKWWT